MQEKFLCIECGRKFKQWFGVCKFCNSWGSIEELQKKREERKSARGSLNLFNRVRIKSDGVVLIYGDPGVGKTGIVLRLCQDHDGVLITTEQSVGDLEERLNGDRADIVKEKSARGVCELINTTDKNFIIVDSLNGLDEIEGLFSRSKQYYQREFLEIAIEKIKEQGKVLVITSYVNKKGEVKGLRDIEHSVDVVLRVTKVGSVRRVSVQKNRFAASDFELELSLNNRGVLLGEVSSNELLP